LREDQVEDHDDDRRSDEFETGKTNLIIGQSGSGKTVLLKCLVGLHAVDSGEIFYDDIRYTALGFKERKAIRKDIAKGRDRRRFRVARAAGRNPRARVSRPPTDR